MQEPVTSQSVLEQAFPGIGTAQAKEIISSGRVVSYPAGTVLCQEGALETIFYLILAGKVRVTKKIHGQHERTLQRLERGSFFGEMAILHDAPRAATVTTIEPTTVLEIRKDAFSGMIERSSSVSLAVVREVSRRLRENDEMTIEDLRLKAKELADAYQQLAEEEFARSQFLTVAAHELRTPLMSANGYLQAIRGGMFTGEAQAQALETVWRSLQEITSLTNDILFMQEMELILPEFHPTHILAVILAAIEQEQPLAERIGVSVLLHTESELPLIDADPKSLQRALAAILNNAIKFSPEGGEVSVSITRASTEPSADLYITIVDQGVGIPPEAMHRIFQRFFHLDIICGRVFRGIGLGLSIARHVIEQHHGTVEVESQLEKGSTFRVRIPIQPV